MAVGLQRRGGFGVPESPLDGHHVAAGRVRMEGKDYVMADGDVVEFRFNV